MFGWFQIVIIIHIIQYLSITVPVFFGSIQVVDNGLYINIVRLGAIGCFHVWTDAFAYHCTLFEYDNVYDHTDLSLGCRILSQKKWKFIEIAKYTISKNKHIYHHIIYVYRRCMLGYVSNISIIR